MVKLVTLGRVAVLASERPVPLRERKQLALLVYLAAHAGQTFTREQIASLLWPKSVSRRARHSLSQAIYRLRSKVPGLTLQCSGDELWLPREGVEADFLAFRHAISQSRFYDAAHLYQGDFLQGFWIAKAPEYEEWQEAERDSLRQAMSFALHQILEVEEKRGNWFEVERIASRILSIDPYLESVHRARILAIAASGDRARALRTWRQAEAMFVRDLSRAPDELAAAVRPLLEWKEPSIQMSTSESQQLVVPFIGRGEQFSELRMEWERVKAGHGRVVLLTGEAGIGKSRLCMRFLKLAAIQGARCFEGRCYTTESLVPYSGITDALSRGIGRQDLLDLHGQWANELAGLLPQFVPHSDAEHRIEMDDRRRRLFEAFVQLFLRLSQKGPVAVFIDDFHWADNSTIALVHFLARRLSDHPILFLLALRWEERARNATLRSFQSSIEGLSNAHTIRLAEMPSHEARELIRIINERDQLSLTPENEDYLIKYVGGRPFIIIEYLRACRNDRSVLETARPALNIDSSRTMPASIERKLTSRFTDLPESEVRIVGALAVLGKGAQLNTLCQIAGVSDLDAVQGIAPLIEAGTLVESHNGISFSHPLLREAAYRWIGGPRRRVLHARAAEVLRNTGGSSAGTLAVHFDLAGQKREAFAHAVKAAEQSEEIHSVVEAEYFLRMALANAESELERNEVRGRLARFLYGCRRHAEAEEHFARLEPVYAAQEDEKSLLLAEVNRIAAARRRGSISSEEAVARLKSCVEIAERNGDDLIISQIWGRLVDAAHDTGHRSVILKAAERLNDLADRIQHAIESVRCTCVASTIIGLYSQLGQGLEICRNAVERARQVNQPEVTLIALRSRAGLRFFSGMIEAARQDLNEANALVDRVGNEMASFELTNTSALLELECGNYNRSAELLNGLIHSASQRHSRHDHLIANANLMVLEFERGDLARARELAERILDWNRTVSVWWCNITAWGVLGHYALVRGDYTEANRCRRELMLLYEGRDFLVLDVSYAEGFLARLSTIDGDADKALERLDRAIAAYEGRDVFCRSRLQLERARVLLELDVAQARLQAEEVKAFGERIGAHPLVRKAEDVLALA